MAGLGQTRTGGRAHAACADNRNGFRKGKGFAE
jgi:hypothetical protein